MCAVLLGGCADNGQNTLHARSHQTETIAVLWWVMLAVASVVFLGAVAMLVLAWLRRRRSGLPYFGEREDVDQRLVVGFGIVGPIVVLIALFVTANIVAIGTTAAPGAGTTALTIRVVGHQWWWEARYPRGAVTANEIHIPVGRRVDIAGTTADVIHSIWIPELNRKIDVIPGRTNNVLLDADRAGTFRGQCAEFCGPQHAHMGLRVIAQRQAQFDRWLAQQAAVAAVPRSAAAVRGRAAFMGASCASCHTIRGTPAQGTIGPDLTHVGSRSTLAALTIANRPSDMLRWITDPQSVKPTAKMPALDLPSAQFRDIVSYLEGLR